MKYLKQRTPLSYDTNGKPLLINKDFGDDIEKLVANQSSNAVDLTGIQAQIDALKAQVLSLQATVKTLQDAYQS